MFSSQLNTNIEQAVNNALATNPSFMPITLAKELNTPEAVVISALPKAMRTFVEPSEFEVIWNTICDWEKITFIVPGNGAIIEFQGQLPKGKFGHGYFNLMQKNNPLGGHLMVSEIATICFVNKDLFGLESLSVQFYNHQGDQMFGIYVGREKRKLFPAVKQSWLDLRSNYC